MQNPDIARVFDEVADLLEIQDANPFRVRAYRNAARTIRDYPEPIAELVHSGGKDLTEIPGIGEDLAEKITDIVKTGELPLRKQLAAKLPAGLLDLLRIPGLGPKRVKVLHKKLKVKSAADLAAALDRETARRASGGRARRRARGVRRRTPVLHWVEGPQRRAAQDRAGPRAQAQRVRAVQGDAPRRGSDRGGDLRQAGPRLDPSRAARGARRDRARPRAPAPHARRAERRPRRPPDAYQRHGRAGDVRRDGGRGARAPLRVHRHHGPLEARDH